MIPRPAWQPPAGFRRLQLDRMLGRHLKRPRLQAGLRQGVG